MVDQETFEEKLWKLNETGDFSMTLKMVNIILGLKYKDRNGSLIDIEFLVNRYKEYITWWENKFGDKDPRFIRNADNLKPIYDFLGDNMYQSEWKSPPKIRDSYLFGNKSIDELKASLEKFKKSLHGP